MRLTARAPKGLKARRTRSGLLDTHALNRAGAEPEIGPRADRRSAPDTFEAGVRHGGWNRVIAYSKASNAEGEGIAPSAGEGRRAGWHEIDFV